MKITEQSLRKFVRKIIGEVDPDWKPLQAKAGIDVYYITTTDGVFVSDNRTTWYRRSDTGQRLQPANRKQNKILADFLDASGIKKTHGWDAFHMKHR